MIACLSALLAGTIPAWTWGQDGHQIVARIAALNLTPKARRNVARLLGARSNPNAAANAMGLASVWPDTYLRKHAPSTEPWHFIDICRDAEPGADLNRFCPGGQCITKKIEEYRANIPRNQFDEWGGKGDLSLLIHFLGDVHQPLHCTTNADRGGNCVTTTGEHSNNLHSAWDTDIVREIEGGNSVRATAEQLNEDARHNPAPDPFDWTTGTADGIALESHALAESEIYQKLAIPAQSCIVELKSCDNAPQAVRDLKIELDPGYVGSASAVVRKQLTRAGLRLGALLNRMWQ